MCRSFYNSVIGITKYLGVGGSSSYGMDIEHKESFIFSNRKLNVCKFWKKVQAELSPGGSQLASFLWHSSFQAASAMSKFQVWEEKGLGQFCRLGRA